MVIGVVNTVGSTIARETDAGMTLYLRDCLCIYIHAGD